MQTSGAMRRENAKLYPPSLECEAVSTVIASAAKQSISRLAETWIASLRSQ